MTDESSKLLRVAPEPQTPPEGVSPLFGTTVLRLVVHREYTVEIDAQEIDVMSSRGVDVGNEQSVLEWFSDDLWEYCTDEWCDLSSVTPITIPETKAGSS